MKIEASVYMKRPSWTNYDIFRITLDDDDLQQLAFEKAKECKSFPEEFIFDTASFDKIDL